MMVNFWVSPITTNSLIPVLYIAFGKDALQMYAEMLDEEETAMLF
jgi:hypothetical protein